MLLLVRTRYPRLANILSPISGVISLAIAYSCHASLPVYIFGGGSSLLFFLVRHYGKGTKLDRNSAAAR